MLSLNKYLVLLLLLLLEDLRGDGERFGDLRRGDTLGDLAGDLLVRNRQLIYLGGDLCSGAAGA